MQASASPRAFRFAHQYWLLRRWQRDRNHQGFPSKKQLTRLSLDLEGCKTVKRIVISSASISGLFFAVTLLSNLSVKGNSGGEAEGAPEAQIGFRISPVKLDLKGKDPLLVGLGSYIVNAQGGCNDCHTCPSYAPGHNPFPPPFGVGGDGQINAGTYLAGGVDFGPPGNVVTSANLTPDPATGRPEGLTLEQFEIAIRTGHDPVRNDNLAVMPWPYYRHMTDRISTRSTPI